MTGAACSVRRGTCSIVARDRRSGELGVAVQSHWFSVGSVVAWARPGVGAVATQSVAEVAHGSELAPEADELIFWAGLGVAERDLPAGVELVQRAAARKPAWLALLARLPAELAPTAGAIRDALAR